MNLSYANRTAAGNFAVRPAARNLRLAAAVVVALALGGCSASMIDSLPTEVGGLPVDAPKRSATVPAYPSVSNVPARADTPLTSEQQFKLEEELNTVRARQNGLQNKNAVSRAHAEAEKTSAARARAVEAANASRRQPAPR